MRKALPALFLLLTASPAWALGGYFGMGVGQAEAQDVAAPDVPGVVSGSVDDTDTSLNAFVGYEFSPNVSAELTYVDFGEFRARARDLVTGDSAEVEVSANAMVVSLLGFVPLQEEFAVFGRAGLAISRVNADLSTNFGLSAGESGGSTAPVFGIGVQYGFDTRFLLRAEFNRYQDVGDDDTGESDLDLFGVSAGVRF